MTLTLTLINPLTLTLTLDPNTNTSPNLNQRYLTLTLTLTRNTCTKRRVTKRLGSETFGTHNHAFVGCSTIVRPMYRTPWRGNCQKVV